MDQTRARGSKRAQRKKKGASMFGFSNKDREHLKDRFDNLHRAVGEQIVGHFMSELTRGENAGAHVKMGVSLRVDEDGEFCMELHPRHSNMDEWCHAFCSELDKGEEAEYAIRARGSSDGEVAVRTLFGGRVSKTGPSVLGMLADSQGDLEPGETRDHVVTLSRGRGNRYSMSIIEASDTVARQYESHRVYVLSQALAETGRAVCAACCAILPIRGKKCAMRCSGCKVACYCSLECQRRDFADHRISCPRLARCHAHALTVD